MLHSLIEFEKNIDPKILALCLYMLALGLIGGWAICQVTHKQRGIEVDRPLTDNLPLPPAPIVVPDHVPDEWKQDA